MTPLEEAVNAHARNLALLGQRDDAWSKVVSLLQESGAISLSVGRAAIRMEKKSTGGIR